MKKYIGKGRENCLNILTAYDEEGKDNRPETIKILIATWLGIFLFALVVSIFSVYVGFHLPQEKIMYAVKFFIFMQAASFLILSLNIKDSYSVFIWMQYLSLFIFGTAFCALAFYSTATLNLPFIDDNLIQFDHFIGFDWKKYIDFVSHYKKLQSVFNIAYNSMIISIVIIIFALVISKNSIHLQRFCIAYFLTLFATVILACSFPAMAGYVHYDVEPALLDIYPAAPRIHEEHMLDLRSGILRSVPEKVIGIVTFPSFHAAAGLLLVWGFYPVIWLRMFMFVLNTTLIIATPFSGGHYLIDIIGGLFIALLAIFFSYYILPEKNNIKNKIG